MPAMYFADTRHSEAFTLLELILVLALIATMLAIATPSLRRFYLTNRTEDAARHLLTVCAQARTRAIAEARTYRLNIDSANRTYWLTVQNAGTYQRLGSEFGRTFTIDPGVDVSWNRPDAMTDQATITFLPDGRSQTVQVVFADAHGTRVAVVCSSPSQPFCIAPLQEDFVGPTIDPSME